MKKWLIAGCFLVGGFSSAVLADARSDLQNRLSKVSSFQANFTQSVSAVNGASIQEGKGVVWVERPNHFRWHTTAPDESLLVSDGSTLWFYNPFVEQVTASDLNSATNNTPFILIARNSPTDWNQYEIKQSGDNFSLNPKNQKGNLKQFQISVSKAGVIQRFTAIEQDGQRSTYELSGQKTGAIAASEFSFTPPAGVTVDDQRQKRH